jgi:protein ImuA
VRNDVPGGDRSVLVPPSGVAKAGGARARVLIEHLRAQIRALEQVPVSLANPPAPGAAPPHRPACSLVSPPTFDFAGLGPAKRGGLHEIRPETYRDHPAALGFALALLAEHTAERKSRNLVLWCFTREAAREWGRPYGPGLIAWGLDPALFLLVEARNAADAAWALEEGLKSRALVAALAAIEIKTELTARRLGLAAQASRTPCLLLSDHRRAGLPGTLTSWRIAAQKSGPVPFDASAPGAPSWHLTLARCRGETPGRSFIVEFSHESFRIHLFAASSARAADAGESSIRRRASSR